LHSQMCSKFCRRKMKGQEQVESLRMPHSCLQVEPEPLQTSDIKTPETHESVQVSFS
jgi:hypothetical protein